MIDYEVYLKKPSGERIGPLVDETNLDVTLNTNAAGTLTMSLDCCSYTVDDFPDDTRIEICCICNCNGDSFLLGKAPFFIERAEKCDSDGTCTIKITAVSATGLLARRVIPYSSESAKGKADNEPADNLIKRLFRENGGVAASTGNYNQATDPNRYWGGCISVCANTSQAPGYTGTFGGQNLLTVMQNIASASEAKDGKKLYFGIFQPGGCCTDALEFCTWVDTIGKDTGVTVSADNDTVGNYCISRDAKQTINRVYASGKDNAYAIASDPDLTATLVDDCFALRESTTSATNDTGTGLQDAANAELKRQNKPFQFDGDLTDSDGFQMGCDWNWGDTVNVYADGYTFTSNIDTLRFTQNQGLQTISASLSTSNTKSSVGVASIVNRLKELQREIDRLKSLF